MSILSRLGFAEEKSNPDPGPPAPPETITESSFHAQEVVDLARTSLDFLAGLAIPTVYEYHYPPVFLAVWDWMLGYVHKTRDFSQLALGLPRGFGKTALMKLFILYCILFTDKRFILIICENTSKAVNILSFRCFNKLSNDPDCIVSKFCD